MVAKIKRFIRANTSISCRMMGVIGLILLIGTELIFMHKGLALLKQAKKESAQVANIDALRERKNRQERLDKNVLVSVERGVLDLQKRQHIFRGIVLNDNDQKLALIDQDVYAVGDTLDGHRISAITETRVELVDPSTYSRKYIYFK